MPRKVDISSAKDKNYFGQGGIASSPYNGNSRCGQNKTKNQCQSNAVAHFRQTRSKILLVHQVNLVNKFSFLNLV